jgi:hypothetical protein
MPKATIDTSEQGSENWHKARIGKFTASRAGDLMKTQKNGKPYATRKNYITEVALERITNQIPEFTESEAMREGKERERTAALAYSFATGNETEQTGFWHTDTWGASPDDLVGEDGGVEYKNPQAATHYQTLMTGEIPEHYYWQVIQCLLATERKWWDYVSFHPDFPENAQLFIKRINRAEVEKDIVRLAKELVNASDEAENLIKQVKEYNNA